MADFTRAEFDTLLADTNKAVVGDIAWETDQDHSACVEFMVEVTNDFGYPLFAKGTYNREAQTLSYAIIHRGVGRVYGLDLGKDHRNPSNGKLVGEKHKHPWTNEHRDKEAYVPDDITANAADPVTVWQQFCQEAGLSHEGAMKTPVPPKGIF